MDSNRLPFGFIPGQQQNEKYEWQQLILRQKEQATTEEACHSAKLSHHLHGPNSDRVEDSVTAIEISHGSRSYYNLHRSQEETKNYSNEQNQPLDRPAPQELKRYRKHTFSKCGLKRTGENSAFYGHGHPAAISYPKNGIGGYHGQGHAHRSHSKKRVRCRFSSDPASAISSRFERSPSFGHGKGARVCVHGTARPGKIFSLSHENSTENRHYQEERHLHTETGFRAGHPLKKHESTHRLNILRDEVGRAHTKKPIDELQAIHHKQHEFSTNEDFYGQMDSRQNLNVKSLKRKRAKCGYWDNNYNEVSVRRHGRNSPLQRCGDQLAGKNSKNNMAYKDQYRGAPDRMRNNNREGLAEAFKEVGQHVLNRNFHPKKNILTAARCTGSMNSDDNSDVSSHKYSNKTFASSNGPEGPKQSEGSIDIKLESEKQLTDVDSTKTPWKMRTEQASRVSSQHPPVIHIEKDVHTKESGNVSQSELLHDCLIMWRRLRKDNSSTEAETVIHTDKLGTTKRVSIGGRVRDGRASACLGGDDENNSASDYDSVSSESASENDLVTSESNDESSSALENSEQYRSSVPSDRIQKCGERRARRMPEQTFGCLRVRKCNKSPQNTMAEQGLRYDLEFSPEANPGEIIQQKEQDKLSCNQLSTVHPDARIQTKNSCSDASKVDQSSHPDSSMRHEIFQHETISGHFDRRVKYKLAMCCELEDAGGDIANWDVQKTSLSADPTLLDQKTVSLCSRNDENLKAKALECSNQKSEPTTFSGPKLDVGTANNCPKQPVNCSSERLCGDIKNLAKESCCGDIPWDAVNGNISKSSQECSTLADSRCNVCQIETVEVHELSQTLEMSSNQLMSDQYDSDRANSLEMSSNQQITHQFHSDRANSHADWNSCSAIPDLNSLPDMDTNEEFKAGEEMIYQISENNSKPENANESLSGPIGWPVPQEEQHREGSNSLLISNSHNRPPEADTVEGSSKSIDEFKAALCEFIKNILKPLWEDGLLSREVHKIIVRKAVEKVALGTKTPVTNLAIHRFLSDESESVEKLVQSYLELYVGREVLKRSTRTDNI